MLIKIMFIILFCLNNSSGDLEYFQQDLGNDMTIGLSENGYKSVKLKCGSDSMKVELQTDEDFSGVIYTRGSYHDRKQPCFLDPGTERSQRSFTMKFPLDKCNTQKAGDVYSNVVVLQYDKELIMPGDAAFKLECDFGTPRDITVQANMQSRKSVVSRISLTDADPSEKRHKRAVSVESDSFIVEFQPGANTDD